MATTTTTTSPLQHLTHKHPLLPRDFSNDSFDLQCLLCDRNISGEAYTCQEKCKSYYYHKVCAEAPPLINSHPLHSQRPLTLVHGHTPFYCDHCGKYFHSDGTTFRCDECDFDLDVCCAVSTLSDRGGFSGDGTTPDHISLPFHPHKLTFFSTRHDFVGKGDCVICKVSVDGDGYMCLRSKCKLLIHKRCIQDLYYVDGTKAPRVYHNHPLKIFQGEEMGSIRCAKCKSNTSSGEFIGCERCEVYIHRDCIKVVKIVQYPHHPDHILALFINSPDNDKPRCDSCSDSLEGELCYGCPLCEFFAHVGCAQQVLAYCEEGMRDRIKLSWHEHPLFLCHRAKVDSDYCYYCGDVSDCQMYACKDSDCEILVHKRCTEIETNITSPHHPDHQLTLREDVISQPCDACYEQISFSGFSCELCKFSLHPKCAAGVPSRKHFLHYHELRHLDEAPSLECIRCRTSTNSSLFRCVPCDFTIHEKCMQLPQVLKSGIHWDPLTLHETFVEDETGEYYCEHCEKKRDIRLGAYVCGICKISLPRIYHIECALPELGKAYTERVQTSAINRMTGKIKRKKEQVSAGEENLEKVKQELDELKLDLEKLIKENEELISDA